MALLYLPSDKVRWGSIQNLNQSNKCTQPPRHHTSTINLCTSLRSRRVSAGRFPSSVLLPSLRVGEDEARAAAAGHGGALGQRVEEGVLRGHQAPPPPGHCCGCFHFGHRRCLWSLSAILLLISHAPNGKELLTNEWGVFHMLPL